MNQWLRPKDQRPMVHRFGEKGPRRTITVRSAGWLAFRYSQKHRGFWPFQGSRSRGEHSTRGSWLREKDCQLTFSEIVSPNLVEGVRLGTKSCIEKTRKFCRRNFASHSRIKSKSPKVAWSVPVRVLRSQIALPTRAPIPAVSAIANAPQKVTLIVGLRTSAPPALAPTIPSSLSDLRDKRSNRETNGIDESIFSNEIPP